MYRLQPRVRTGQAAPTTAVASDTEALHQLWAKQAADTAADRAAKNAKLRSDIAKYSWIAGPYAAAAQAFTEGAIFLGNALSHDPNSDDDQHRALRDIQEFMRRGFIAPSVDTDLQFAEGYANGLESILQRIDANPKSATINKMGQVFKQWATRDPIVATIANSVAKGFFGFFNGQITTKDVPAGTVRVLYPERALFLGRLAALEHGVDPKPIEQIALRTWNVPVDAASIPRNEKGDYNTVDLYVDKVGTTYNSASAWAAEAESKQSSFSKLPTPAKVVLGGGLLTGLYFVGRQLISR